MPGVDVLERLGRPPAVAALDGEDAVYVVGGAVRDLLLGRQPHELDFVVEGDAVAVARRAAERLGGRVTVHERFGTATVEAPDATFDLAGARRERYERPGALPDVELGASLRDDLARRDFTVNAIALHLSGGELIWFPRAEEDLRAARLRVLHDGSFRDDPTRLLRLVRYGARLGFEPDAHTDELAAQAVAGGAVDTVTRPRLGAELRLLLREPQPEALARLERHGLGAALLGPDFAVHEPFVRAAIRLCPPDGGADLVAFAAALASSQDRPALSAALDRLGFPAADREIVASAATGADWLCDTLEPGDGPLSDAALWRLLRAKTAEAVTLAGAYGGAADEAAQRWLRDVRHRRLAITGDDFVAAGLSGPPVGVALDAATEAMLDGRAPTPEAQLAAGLEAAGA